MMNVLRGLFRAIFSRYTLALAALVVGGLVLWFLGPLLSFGGLQPLQQVGARATVIALLLVLLLCLLLNWSLLLVGMAALCLLIWHTGPLLALGEWVPLQPVWVRVVLIAVLLLGYAIYGLFRLYKALRADEDLVRRWLHPDRGQPNDLAKEEIRTLSGIVRQGVDQLKHMRHGRGQGPGLGAIRRLFEGKQYVYELPWYMILGVPGSGKTTALLNSGCNFPIAQQMGAASAQLTLSTDAGTVNTHWWFTNEAVLIDTAGRYTMQNDGAQVPTVASLRPASDAHEQRKDATATPLTAQEKNAAEWRGYLGLLRKHRPNAPINGALVAISLADLVTQDEIQRTAQAALLRARLAELRRELGVRFPVYVLVTKADLLKGFADYFGALTTEGRSQVWGLTLPWSKDGISTVQATQTPQGHGRPTTEDDHTARTPLGSAIGEELRLLRQRLEDGIATRLQEEFDLERRQRLYALPQEFGGVTPALTRLLEDVFQDSRFDDTELSHSLRGVYFTSALQSDTTVVAEPNTLMRRLLRLLPSRPRNRADQPVTTGNRSFFIHDVLSRLVFREPHLVQPNLGWQRRLRLARLVGHALAVVAFVWLAGALVLSYQNNRRYLADVSNKAEVLADQVGRLFARFRIEDVPETLTAARLLPSHAGLDLIDPPTNFRYGLYTPPPIQTAATDTYDHLQDQMLLPQITRRMENALAQGIVDGNDTQVFETLRVYLMLQDKAHYQAGDVKAWVLKDWESGQGARALGTQTALQPHLEALFSGGRVVQSPLIRNDGLIQRARTFLDGRTSTTRLYERARAAMAQDAPPDFTLLRVIGPQAGMVFRRLSGQSLERGVPGLYTYEGYHELFSERLPEMVARAQAQDAWVMGQEGSTLANMKKQAQATSAHLLKVEPLMEDVRRQYLTEYAQHWSEFLADIAPITGSTLAFDLNVLRQFAAPDSPLVRLARAAVRETTLSRSLEVVSEADKSYLDRAAEQLDKQAFRIKKNLGLRPEAQLERQLVDNQFAALREVVTGQSETQAYGSGAGNLMAMNNVLRGGVSSGVSTAVNAAAYSASTPAPSGAGVRTALDGITAMVNDFYTVLAVADTAIASNSLPANGKDAGARMRMEAARLPAPFKEVLTELASSGADKVAQGASGILRVQAQAQVDRLLGLMAMQVSEPCKRMVDGHYPFADSAQEVNIDDFNTLFATGGVMDTYFTQHLAPFVDTSARPWRYKSPNVGNMMVPIETAGDAATPAATGPTLTGELLKLLTAQGPNPDVFARVGQIREVFFRDGGGKKMSWKMEFKVQEIDPTINELIINVDGQGQRYVHGPIQPIPITWPGPRGGTVAELTATPRIRPETSTIMTSGPWALMRLIDRGRVVDSATGGRVSVEYQFDGRRAVLDISTGRLPSPLTSTLLRSFRCPGRI